MKKILKIVLPIVIATTLGSTSIFIFRDNTDYYVDTTYFQSTYAYKDDLDLSGLKIVETEKDEVVAEYQVEENMVVSCDSTSSVGEKTLILQYEKEQFVVNFVVMYEIKFIANNEVINLQYVYKASEIKSPEEPKLTGNEFVGWNPQIPNVINDNMTFEAEFRDTPAVIPNLGSYEATYSDTLESIVLPSNQYGSWRFVDDLTTTVGNVGTNIFEVEFIPTNSELKVIKDTVEVIVSKKQLEFKNVITTFEYDGLEHLPTYELDVEGLNVITMGTPGIEVGTYFIMYVIQDDNYEGQWHGNFTIASTEISISFDLTENVIENDPNAYYKIALGDSLPEFKYSVSGIDDPSLLQISLSTPKVNHAVTYEVTLTIGNSSYKNVDITNKCYLVVEKTSLGAGLPELTTQAVYGNKLSSVLFEDNNPNGYWEWENPDYLFEYAGEHKVNIVFTPYSSLDYEVEIVEVNLNALKRTLTFGEIVSNYTYDGLEHTIAYKLFDGENEITGINVEGQIVQTNAGSYETKLVIEEANYDGSYDAVLKIAKATPEIKFDVVFDDIVIGTVLDEIEGMPEGYSWVLGATILTSAGSYEYDVLYTPEDIDNFVTVTGKFTVNVIKKTTSIEVINPNYEFTYDGTVHTLTGIYPKRKYDTSELKFYNIDITDSNNANITPQEVVLMNAGTYTVYITLLENDEYYTAVEEVTVIIDGSSVDTPIEYSATYGDLLSSIELPKVYDENNELIGTWVWENQELTTTVGDAGIQFHKAIFESVNSNYENDPVKVKVTVAKKAVSIQVITSEYDYDGLEHSIVYEVLDGEDKLELTVSGNATKVNQGKYAVTLTINENNYSGSVSTELIINSIDPEVEWPTLYADVFTTLYDLKKNLVEGMSFDCEDIIFENIGEYTFDAEFVQPNDEYNNYNKLTGTVTVIVVSVEASITGVAESYEFTYGDKVVINAVPSHNESELTFTYSQNEVVVNEIRNVGTYDVNITLPATDNYNESVVTTTVSIVEKEVNVEWVYEEAYEYTGEALETPSAYFQDIDGNWIQLTVSELNNNEFINAGTYQFTASFDSEYEERTNYNLNNVDSNLIEVTKVVIDLSKYTWNYTGQYVYNGTEYKVELLNVHSALLPIYENNIKIDAGDYTAKVVSFDYDENNYELVGEVAVCEWSITTSAVAVKWEYKESYTFTGYELELPKATILNGTIELDVTIENATEFRNAGTYVFNASLDSSNYVLSNTRLTSITVSKAELTVEWTYETSYVYTDEVLNNPVAKVTDLLETEIELNVVSNNGDFKNVNEYTFNASFAEDYLDKDNYILNNTLSDKVEILKADYDLSGMLWNYSNAFTYDGLEQKVELTNIVEGLTAYYEGNTATNVGEYQATVTFDYDKANYNEPTFDALDWKIEAETSNVEWTYETSYVYTGSILVAPTATYENVEGEVLPLFVKEVDGKEFKAAGQYTFVASIADPTIANNYSLNNSSIEVSIESTNISFDKQLTAIYGQTLANITSQLPTSDFGAWSFVDELTTSVGNAGSNKFTVYFESNSANYESGEKEVYITVNKKTVVIEVVKNTFTYDGTNKTIEVKVLDGTNELDINVLGNETAKTAGTYTTTLAINEVNYLADAVETSLVINKAEAVITNNLTIDNSDYDGEEVDLIQYFELNHEETELNIDITLARAITVIKNAGTYTVVVSASETTNYSDASIEVTYTINKVSPNMTYTAKEDGYTYNGANISVADYISHENTDSNVEITYVYQFLEDGTFVSVDSICAAGTYKVTATITETTNYIADTISFELEVQKGHFDIESETVVTATYGQKLSDFDLPTNDERGTWAWENPDSTVGEVGERIHNAILTYYNDSIAASTVEVTFDVQPKPITITLGQTSFDYDGNAHTVTYTLGETPEGVSVDVEGTITATDYVAGGYAFTLTIAGNDNYTGTVSGVLTINQISSGVNAPELSAVYNETYEDIVLPENENGKWSFEAELSTSVGNFGTKTVVLQFTPNSTNYKIENMNATLTVAKADYTPTAIPTTYDNATYGDLLSKLELPTIDENGTWRWDATGTVGNAGVNYLTATFTHENSNYNTYQTTVTINVAKAESFIINKLPATLTYTGSELIKQYFTLNHDEENLVFKVTGKGTSVVAAGTYTVVVSVDETTNYKAQTTDEIVVEVAKATPATDFNHTFTYTYGKVLSNDDLSAYDTELGHYEWVTPDVLLDVNDEKAQPISAKFVPKYAENYNVVQGTFTVIIKRITGTITVDDNQTFIYGDVIDLGAKTNNTDGKTIVETGLTLNSDNLVDVGTYDVTLTVAESTHYTAATITITVTITQAYEEIELPETFEYGTTISKITPTTSEYGEFTVYETNPNEVNSLSVSYNSNLNATVVETKTIWVKFTPYEEHAKNYAEFIEEIIITIVRKEITFENIKSTFTYDGLAHEVEYTLNGVVGEDTPEVTGNTAITNVTEGKVSVTLSIDTKYYYGSTTVTLEITPATPKTDFTTVYDAFWNTNLSAIELPTGYSWDADETLSTVKDGQEFSATYNAETSSTYDPNYTSVSDKFTVNVNKLATELTVTSDAFDNPTYVANKTYTISVTAKNGNEATPVVKVNGSTTYSIGSVGTYTVIVTVEETDHYEYAEFKTEFTISKATPTTSFTTILSGVYGNKLSSVSFPNATNGTYTWSDEDTVLATGEQTYRATFTPSDEANYNSVTADFTVNVAKAEATVTANASYTFTYNGKAVVLTGITASHSESTVTYDTLINAGKYNITITLPGSTNYNEATTTTTVVINEAKVSAPTGLTASYGQTLANITSQLPTSEYGTWSFTSDLTTSVGNAGSNKFTVSFTSTNDNYASYETEVVITVSMIDATVTDSIPTNLVYTGAEFDYTKWFTTNNTETTMAFEITGADTIIKNEGSYTITVKMSATTNYNAFSKSYTVSVAQADYTVTAVAVAANTTYGDVLSTVALSNGDTTGTWSWKEATTVIKGVGTLTYVAVFTPTNTNYKASEHNINVEVAKMQVTITVTDSEFVYDGNAHSLVYEVNGLLDGDTVEVTGNTSITKVLDSISSVTLTIKSDYYEGSVTSSLTITKATPTISLPTHTGKYEDIVVDENLVSSATASTTGTFSYDKTLVVYDQSTDGVISIVVTFTPSDTDNYNTVQGNMSVTLLPVAYKGSAKYGTIEKALDDAVSGDVVYVYAGTSPIIRNNINIFSGVTLSIPYADGAINSSTATLTATNFSSMNCTTKVTVMSEVTIKIYGILEIGGELSGGGGAADACGHTAGKYSKVVLGEDTKIINSGIINCYGLIEEEDEDEDEDNGSQVIVNSSARINMPFVLRDFKGGSVTYGIYNADANISPFNEFEFRNITCTVRYNYGSILNTWANIYANSQQNYTTIAIIGTSNALINLTDKDNSYLISKYNATTEVHDIDIYGGAYSGTMKLKLNVGFSVTVSTEDVYFPLSWRYDISMNVNSDNSQVSATYTMSQKFKLMTGSKLTVNAGANLTINEINIYETYTDSLTTDSQTLTSYENMSEAIFTVNGTVTATILGGKVYTDSNEGAQLSISTASISTYEATHVSGSSFFASLESKQTITNTLSLQMYDETSSSVSSFAEQSAGVYISQNGGWILAENTYKFIINFETNGGDALNSLTIYKIIDENDSSCSSYTIDVDTLPSPIKKYYEFADWYTNSSFEEGTEADGYTMSISFNEDGTAVSKEISIILYADWNVVDFSIGYTVSYVDCETSNSYSNPNDTTYNATSTVTLQPASDGNLVFYGWYLDPEYTVKLESIYANMGGYGLEEIMLYGYFNENPSYTITFDDNLSDTDRETLGVNQLNSIEVPSGNTTSVYTGYNEDYDSIKSTSYSKYFVGWYTDEALTVEFKLNETIVNGNLTLYAKWGDKIVIETVAGTNAPSGYTVTNGTNSKLYFFPTEECLKTYVVDGCNIDFYSGNNTITQQYYFNGWVSNSTTLNGTALTTAQIDYALTNGGLTVSGEWKSKVVVTFEITGDLDTFTYEETSYTATNNTYYFMAGATFTISTNYTRSTNSKASPTYSGLTQSITTDDFSWYWLGGTGTFEATYTVNTNSSDEIPTASITCAF